MKSLEHIIRDIREGKCECEKKKDSLEHAIRKVAKKEYESSYGAKDSKPVEEGIGTLGTDKYQGTEFKSIRTATPHIKPPSGEGTHSQAPENASRLRSIAKEKQGINRVTEEELEEAKRSSTSAPSKTDMEKLNAKTQYAEPPTKTDIKVGPVGEPPAAPTKSTAVTTTTPSAPAKVTAPETALSRVGRYASEIGKVVGGKAATALSLVVDPDFGGLLPSKGETKSEFERQKEYAGKTKTVTAPEPTKTPEVEVKTTPKEVPKVVVPTTTTTPKATPVTTPETKPQVAVPPTPPSKPMVPAAVPSPKMLGISIGKGSVSGDIAYDTLHKVPHKVGPGHAKKHKTYTEGTEVRKDIENMPRKGDRKSIEYVGRKDADPKTAKEKTSRLAVIKNVLDEAKKNLEPKKVSTEDGNTKVFDYGKDVLIVNPDRQRVNLDADNGEKIAKDYDNK